LCQTNEILLEFIYLGLVFCQVEEVASIQDTRWWWWYSCVLQLHHPEWLGKKEKQENTVKDTNCYSNSIWSNKPTHKISNIIFPWRNEFDINLIDKGFILFRYGFSLRVGIPLLHACCLVAVDLIAIITFPFLKTWSILAAYFNCSSLHIFFPS